MSDPLNVILIVTDQQRGDCIGMDEQAPDVLSTPHMDYLARSGVRFRRAYSECPTCLPARRCLMSGLAPAANGAVGFYGGPWQPPHTLADELSSGGYQTQMIGKLHLTPKRKRFGFDHMILGDGLRPTNPPGTNDYAEWLATRRGGDEMDPAKFTGCSTNGYLGRPNVLPEEQTYASWAASESMRFMTRRDPSCPMFLNLSFFEPHPPLTPPEMHFRMYLDETLPKPVVGDWAPRFDAPQRGYDQALPFEACIDERTMHRTRAGYYGLISLVDDQIGRLLEFNRKLLRESLIIFTSDHGEMLGDHNMFCKARPYEGSARIPLIIRPPDRWNIERGTVIDSPVGLQDIMPTILDAAGLDVPEVCTGRSLMPLVRGEAQSVRDVIHGEHDGAYDAKCAHHYLTDGHAKYVWLTQSGDEQLFDLDNDPHELHNLAADGECKPWRDRLIDIVRGRPEGFTDDKRLIAGRPHGNVLPGYEPGQAYPFL